MSIPKTSRLCTPCKIAVCRLQVRLPLICILSQFPIPSHTLYTCYTLKSYLLHGSGVKPGFMGLSAFDDVWPGADGVLPLAARDRTMPQRTQQRPTCFGRRLCKLRGDAFVGFIYLPIKHATVTALFMYLAIHNTLLTNVCKRPPVHLANGAKHE